MTGAPGPQEIARQIAERIAALPDRPGRKLFAVSGPPASGKSTVAAELVDILNSGGTTTGLVPMDGFHLDNSVLEARGLLARKGAPETFDLTGFTDAMRRLAVGGEASLPIFDRALDTAIAGGVLIPRDWRSVVVEGNYLTFDEPGWRDLAQFWSFSAYLDVPIARLQERLIARWQAHGLAPAEAKARAAGNDLPNALRISGAQLATDMTIAA